MAELGRLINNGTLSEPYHFKLNQDIAITSEWVPIGISTRNEGSLSVGSTPFVGIFDGNGHSIEINYSSSSDSNAVVGLFSAIAGKNTRVHDLTVTGSIESSGDSVGLIAGIVYDGAVIDNCQAGLPDDDSSLKIVSGGGIAGRIIGEGHIRNSENYADIEGTGSNNVGGIVGTVNRPASGTIGSLEISGCSNSGNVTSKWYAGGIAGFAGFAEFEACENSGAIAGPSNISGIVGYASDSTIISGCTNKGKITITDGVDTNIESYNSIGGIAGILINASIKNCTNDGEFAFAEESGKTYQAIGGIVGHMNTSSSVSDSTNNKDIIVPTGNTGNMIGGIAGRVYGGTINGSSANMNSNTGSISGTNSVGGITGKAENNSTISYAVNSGSIKGDTAVGGVVGNAVSTSVSYSSNSNEISGSKQIGGIVGDVEASASIDHSNNTGKIDATDIQVGGIAGFCINSTISNSENKGEVTGKTNVGGIVGETSGATINSSDNSGTIIGNSVDNSNVPHGTGGIVGMALNTEISECDNTSEVKALEYLGGLIGRMSGGSIKNSNINVTISILDDNNDTDEPSSWQYAIGGAIGQIWNGRAESITVSGSITASDSTGSLQLGRVGGFVGFVEGSSTFVSCNATGIEMAENLKENPVNGGGFAGYGIDNANRTDCSPEQN